MFPCITSLPYVQCWKTKKWKIMWSAWPSPNQENQLAVPDCECDLIQNMWIKIQKYNAFLNNTKYRSTAAHACRKILLKWVPSACGYSWGNQSQGTWSSRLGVGLEIDSLILQKHIIEKLNDICQIMGISR